MFIRTLKCLAVLILAFASSVAFASDLTLFYRLVFTDKQEAWLFASSHSGYQQDEQVKKALDTLLNHSIRIGVENAFGLNHPDKVRYLHTNYKGSQQQELVLSAQQCLQLFQMTQRIKHASAAELDLPPPAFAMYVESSLVPVKTDVQRPSYQYGWDRYIINYAVSKHHGLEEIEAAVGQMRFFNSFDKAEIDQMSESLCQLAQNQEKLQNREQLMRRELDAYQNRDIEKVYGLEKQRYVDSGWNDVMVYKFLEGRNAYFAKRIVELNKVKHVNFFAIGAAHFGGKESVVHYLESLGVKIIPLRMNEIVP
jgi:uncharacterized protein YbaP (TraB family)